MIPAAGDDKPPNLDVRTTTTRCCSPPNRCCQRYKSRTRSRCSRQYTLGCNVQAVEADRIHTTMHVHKQRQADNQSISQSSRHDPTRGHSPSRARVAIRGQARRATARQRTRNARSSGAALAIGHSRPQLDGDDAKHLWQARSIHTTSSHLERQRDARRQRSQRPRTHTPCKANAIIQRHAE